jgi:hypothetical protein
LFKERCEMRIRLLKDVMENGTVKKTDRPKKKLTIAWWEGTELEVSEATGEKLIDRGDAEQVVVEGAAEAVEES